MIIVNEHILNAMSMIASAHRDLFFKYPLTLGNKGQAMNKLVVALGDLAYYSNHVNEREQREAARWLHAIVAMRAPTSNFCDWCGLRFEPTSFDREHCTCTRKEARCDECERGPDDEGTEGVSDGHVYGCSHYAYSREAK